MTPTPAPDDRDAWLSQALRHAPDADALPPPAVSEAILREARAKARPGGSAPDLAGRGAGWPRRLWDWLGRPGASASLAGVMVALLVGVMWWNQPLPEPGDESADSTAVPAPPEAPVESRRTPVPAATPAQREARHEAPARQQAPRAAAGERQAPAGRPAPSITPPSPERAVAPPPRSAAPAAAMKQERAPARPSDAATGGPPVARLRVLLAAEAPRWSVRRDAGPARPLDAAMQTWLAEFDAAASGAWTAEAAAGAPAAPAWADGESLTLLRDGQAMHTLQLGDTAVRWTIDSGGAAAAGSRSWRALLPQAQTLRESLARALPR